VIADISTIGLVTSAGAASLDPDHDLLVEALARLGSKAVPVIWDDPDVNWDELRAAVIRSTWDYHTRRSEFLRWVDHVDQATDLHNPGPVVRWNTDKRYLTELADAGVPIVPTTYLQPGDAVDHDAFTGEVVVKPAVSAGSLDTARYAPAMQEAAIGHARRLLAAGRSVLVQPYQSAVDRDGETALVYVDGMLSHGFRKGPILTETVEVADGGLFAKEELSERQPTATQTAVGDLVLRTVGERFGVPLYTRVDLLPTPSGPVVLEVELVEPSLYHGLAAGSADRFAAAIVARAGGR
jgi:glutathione synthase/RimK-type ligase-like ATP-grasp enzyme